jgi:hypothetical protein
VVDIGRYWLDWLGKERHSVEAGLAWLYQLYVFSDCSSPCTVYIRSVNCLTYDGLRCARVHLHIAPTDSFQYSSRVERGLVERRVAVNGAHAEKFSTRVVCAEQESVCVLGTDVSSGGEACCGDSHHAQCP